MCGIIGIFNTEQAAEQVAKAIPLLQHRGRDACQSLALHGKSAVGHTLHAVVSHIPQPLQKEGVL